MNVLGRIIDLGLVPETTPADARCIRLVNATTLLGVLACIGSLPFQLTSVREAAFLVTALVSLLVVLVLSAIGRTLAAGLLMCAVVLVTTVGQVVNLGLAPGLQYYLLILAFLPYFVLPKRHAELALGFSLLSGFLFSTVVWLCDTQVGFTANPIQFSYQISMVAVIASVIGGYARALALGAEARMARERRANEALVREVLPERIAAQLLAGVSGSIEVYDEAVIIYADIAGFTPLAESMAPEQIVSLLDELISELDAVCAREGVEKLKTLGDAFIAAAGVPDRAPDAAVRAVATARAFIESSLIVQSRRNVALKLRVGIACGTVAAGIVGKRRYNLDLWGDALVRAEALQREGVPGSVVVDAATRLRAGDRFAFSPYQDDLFIVTKSDVATRA